MENMKGKPLMTILFAGSLILSGCQEDKLEIKLLNEYTNSKGLKITEALFWIKGDNYKNHQLDILYPNGVHIVAVDVFDDGKIDNIYVRENPNKVYVADANSDQEIMRLPTPSEIKKLYKK